MQEQGLDVSKIRVGYEDSHFVLVAAESEDDVKNGKGVVIGHYLSSEKANEALDTLKTIAHLGYGATLKAKPTAKQVSQDVLFVGEILRGKTVNSRYTILQITPNHWGDGAVGIQLEKTFPRDGSLPFWVRPEELKMIYRRFADRPFPE